MSETLTAPVPEAPSTASLPLIVQGDMTVLLEVVHPLHDEARDAIARHSHDVALRLEDQRQRVPEPELVVDDEDVHTNVGIGSVAI